MVRAPQDKPAGQMAPAQSIGGQRTAIRRRVTSTGTAGASSGSSAAASKPARPTAASAGILKFYTDDAPGLKMGPQTVLVLTLVFMSIVVMLHIIGKFRQSPGSPEL
eukprot:GHVS01052430.1.p1 GENE.GHVS01052430.1~~GHVS01052430.1.p1  ORF type:complete len:107 (+),score=19.89 GHVS01052430.1:181-501(+)